VIVGRDYALSASSGQAGGQRGRGAHLVRRPGALICKRGAAFGRPGLTIAVVALCAVIGAIGGPAPLDQERPICFGRLVVLRDADAEALLRPSLGARLGALFGGARAPSRRDRG